MSPSRENAWKDIEVTLRIVVRENVDPEEAAQSIFDLLCDPPEPDPIPLVFAVDGFDVAEVGW